MKIKLAHNFESMISVENLLSAWQEFERGKRNRRDVQEFSLHLMDNIFLLHNDLLHHTYRHGKYQAFKINDPKPRDIHKASVRDRLLHHAIYWILYPFFDRIFIADSYSCRVGKGTHRAIGRFREFAHKISKNNTRTCWALKCDIRKFFANINHEILLQILREYILDEKIIWLLESVIESFSSARPCIGLPLGNLTSQLFVNMYLNKLDQFVKHKLKAEYYIRYCDDFVILSGNKVWLERQIPSIKNFLWKKLWLELHPDKVFIKTVSSGMDFLGSVNFSNHRILRTTTKKRMLSKIKEKRFLLREELISKETFNQSLQSYLGMLSHANAFRLGQKIRFINQMQAFFFYPRNI